MPGFYHFLPCPSSELFVDDRVQHARLAEFGLGDVLADVDLAKEHVIVTEVQKGPDGVAGTILYPRSEEGDPDVLQYRPEKQTWRTVRQSADGPPVRWLGWLTPPTPEGLARRETYPGYLLTDNHGQAWSIPIARSPREKSFTSLPRDVFFAPGGELETQLKPKFDALWEIASQAWDYFNIPVADRSEAVKAIDDVWLAKAAAKVLAVNYRLGPQELTCLYRMGRGILDNTIVTRILLALIDFELVVGFQKKETTGESPGTAGS